MDYFFQIWLQDKYFFEIVYFGASTKEFFRTCNVLPFSCTHLALWRGKVKDPRYMQKKKDSRISLDCTKEVHVRQYFALEYSIV